MVYSLRFYVCAIFAEYTGSSSDTEELPDAAILTTAVFSGIRGQTRL